MAQYADLTDYEKIKLYIEFTARGVEIPKQLIEFLTPSIESRRENE